jgi:hypothetical protein
VTDKTTDFEEPGLGVVTAGDLVGLRREEWPPERLRALDRAVAEARGDTFRSEASYINRLVGNNGNVEGLSSTVVRPESPRVSLGCRETFDLMEAFRNVTWELRQDRLGRFLFSWVDALSDNWCAPVVGPTMSIAICLAYLASKGRPFNG